MLDFLKYVFFFQAEDGIRDHCVTGVQTCALPILKDDFDIEPYWSNTLFKQGTELVALQRDNLELCNLAPADISKQVPAWSLLTSAYLFRDYDHLKKTFQSDVGKEFIKLARDQLGIEVI